jgi:hypothetical protein
VHPINNQDKRALLGEFGQLVIELRCHEDRFFTYFRMTTATFDELLLKISSQIHKLSEGDITGSEACNNFKVNYL